MARPSHYAVPGGAAPLHGHAQQPPRDGLSQRWVPLTGHSSASAAHGAMCVVPQCQRRGVDLWGFPEQS